MWGPSGQAGRRQTTSRFLRRLLEGASKLISPRPRPLSFGRLELRAVTRPDYGRIWDHELVGAVMKIAGDGSTIRVGRYRASSSTMTHNPVVEVTKETTTLYASERDVFGFLVDDTHPIEAGRLPNGDPDLYFRGFYCWNSEGGSKTLGIASFYLRAVCMRTAISGAPRASRRSASGTASSPRIASLIGPRRHGSPSPDPRRRPSWRASRRRASGSWRARTTTARPSCAVGASRSGDNAPSDRIFVGRADIGAAWTKRSAEGRDYLGLKIDDPSFTSPIYANLFEDEVGEFYSLIWSRIPKRTAE